MAEPSDISRGETHQKFDKIFNQKHLRALVIREVMHQLRQWFGDYPQIIQSYRKSINARDTHYMIL